MPKAALAFIYSVDAVNRFIGRITMYLIFVLVGVMVWSSVSKAFFTPSLWTLETAQFVMVAYYILGGPYSIQLGSNVRMDLFYGEWTDRRKAQVDAITVLFLMTYLGVLLYGAFDSTAYSLGKPYNMESFTFFKNLFIGFLTGGIDGFQEVVGRLEHSATAWRPVLWPIKVTMIIGIILMLLQAVSELIKDIAKIKGVTL